MAHTGQSNGTTAEDDVERGAAVLGQLREHTELSPREVGQRLVVVVRDKRWWIAGILVLLLFDLVLAPFFNFWARHTLVAALLSSGLILLLTIWLVDDLDEYRTSLRWGPLSALASQKIVEAALRTEARVSSRISEVRSAVLALETDDGNHLRLASMRPAYLAVFDRPENGLRLLRYISTGDPTRDLDEVISRWGALATVVSNNAVWLSLAAMLRARVASAVALVGEAEDLTRAVADRVGQTSVAPDGSLVCEFPTGWDVPGTKAWEGLSADFAARWDHVAEVVDGLRYADRQLQAIVNKEMRWPVARGHARAVAGLAPATREA